ncbi:hypothetical protein P9112_008573 [Eukaryota sp. TZLM1-RC]
MGKLSSLPPPPSIVHDIKGSRSFALGKMLGVGGFARVYELTETKTRHKYAVKVFEKETLKKDRAREKLSSEIHIQRGLHHPNIVSLYNAFEYDDKVYILLELCPGTTVHQLLQRRKKLNEYEARYIFKKILSGVVFLHSRNVIHRDLKLHNFFFTTTYDIKIGDFGLSAQLVTESESRKTMCGTPNYMAPEIIRRADEGHSFHVDIWSLGIILFTMLFGRPPFETKDLKSTYRRITSVDFTFPDLPNVSEEAKSLISRILQADPQCRPSLTEIELDPWMQGWAPLSLSSEVYTTPITPNDKNLNELERTQSPEPSNHPSVPYVLCWMDYSEKYGLGYILSDGTVGAMFNDESKAFVTPELKERNEFAFIDRKSASPDQLYDATPQIHSLRYCPDDLKKKSKLIMLFEKNLSAHVKSRNTVFSHTRPNSFDQVIYLKSFHCSNRATSFRLSNRILQANFADHSKIIVDVGCQVLTFLDESKQCLGFSLKKKLPSNVAKRLRYLKSLLPNLVSRPPSQ